MSAEQETSEQQMKEHLDNVLPGFTDAVTAAEKNRSKLYVGIHPNEFDTSNADLRTIGIAVKYAHLHRVVIIGAEGDEKTMTRRPIRKAFSPGT